MAEWWGTSNDICDHPKSIGCGKKKNLDCTGGVLFIPLHLDWLWVIHKCEKNAIDRPCPIDLGRSKMTLSATHRSTMLILSGSINVQFKCFVKSDIDHSILSHPVWPPVGFSVAAPPPPWVPMMGGHRSVILSLPFYYLIDVRFNLNDQIRNQSNSYHVPSGHTRFNRCLIWQNNLFRH